MASFIQKQPYFPGTVEACVISVVRTISLRGNNTKENPLRWVTQYWSPEGELLAEKEDNEAMKTN